MEYNNADIQDPSSTPTPDILTQSLTGVLSAPPSSTPPSLLSPIIAAPPTATHPAPPAVVLPTTSVSQSPGEVYAVPIQRYPDFQLSSAQKTTVVESGHVIPGHVISGHVIPGNEERSSATAPGAGDLISEAWSLSCDMTLAWQKENNRTPSNVSTIAPNTEAVINAPASKEMVPNPQKGVVNDSEVYEKVPETISVTVVKIPVKDCEMVDNNGKTINNSIQDEKSRLESEPTGLESAQVQEDIRSAKVNHETASPSKQVTVTAVVDKENQENPKNPEAKSTNEIAETPSSYSKVHQSPDTSKKAADEKSEIDGVASPHSFAEVKTPEAKRKRIRSGDSSNSSTRGPDSSERPQRKRKLPQKLCDDNVLNHSKETSFILKEHSKSQMALKSSPTTKPSTTTAQDAEAERLKQLKMKQFQRLYVMSQRGYIPENPENSNTEEVEDPPSVSPPESPESASPRRTFSLMDIGISLNAKGEVTLSMPDDIKNLAKSGGSININFDMDCLDEDNCLKFKVTEDKEAITSALGNNENNDAPLIESETSSEPERSDSPKIKIEPEEASEMSQTLATKTSIVPSRDSSVQVDLNIINSEEDYLNERLMRASTATGFVSYPRFTNVTGSSLATVHKVLKNVKKGLSIDKFTKKPTWFCSLCNLTGDYGDMGPLFGPFDIYVPPKNSYRNKNMSEGAKNLFEKLSSTFNKDMPFNDENEITVEREEVWLHEDCICWSPGVYMIGFDIYGLEEIFKVARFTVCSNCGEIGASLGCFKEGCTNRYHYRCAIKAKCKLIKSTFTVLCPTHSYGVVDNCLAVKPLMKVRNYLSQEEINESEELLSRRPGEEAREVAVKITKTRIIRSRKSKKKTKKKIDGVGRKSVGVMQESFEDGTPGKPRRYKKVVEQEEEEEEEGEVDDDDEADEGDDVERKPDRPSYECFGCGFQVTTHTSIRRHFKLHPNCRTQHINEAVKMDEPCNPVARVCFSCGHYVPLGQMMVHLRNVPQQRCMSEHYRVIREVRGVVPEKYFDEDRRSSFARRASGADENHFKCYGCTSSFVTRRNYMSHLKMYESCQQENLKHLIAHKSKVPTKYKICFGCGTLVLKSASLIPHFKKNPSCQEQHNQVVSEELDRQKIYDRDIAVVEVDNSDDNESEEENAELAMKLYCSHGEGKIYCSFDKIHAHLRSNEGCIAPHVQGFLESGVLLPEHWLICTNCGRYIRNLDQGINLHINLFGCKFEHMKRSGRIDLREENKIGGQIDSDDEERIIQKNRFIPKIYCRHGPREYSNLKNANRHLRNYDSCLQPHIHGFLKSGEHLPGDWLFCINCGKYVRGGSIRAHLLRSTHGDCAVKHLVKGGGSEIGDLGEDLVVGDGKAYLDSEDDDHEDVEMRDIEEEEEEREEEEKDVDRPVDEKRSEVEDDAHNRGKKTENESDETEKDKVIESTEMEVPVEPVKVKVEMISTSELPHQPSSSSSSPAGTPTPSKTDLLIHCSQCDTKTKDRSYLKKHYRAQHCPVGCGDYDLICTTCVEALKKIVTFPRGLEGFDYNSRLNKEGLKCPECLTVSQKHNTHYIRKHYRDQHCKIGCAKYDQICTGCVAVLEKLTDWPKPLIGHDYSTGPPPVGFQCPKCKKGIDRQYFKRHYRHLHCKIHCIEKDGVCKKCFLVFKKMGMLTKSDGPGVEYKTK